MNNSTLTNFTLLEPDVMSTSVLSPIIIALQVFFFLVGFPLNIYVVVLLIRGGGLDGSIIFSLSQTISEIILALQAPMFIMCHIDSINDCYIEPLTFFTFFCLSCRLFFQCFVCFERYLAVVHPVIFRKYKPLKYRLACTVSLWLYSFTCGYTCMSYFSFLPFTVLGIMLVITLSVHLFFYFSILRFLRTQGPGDEGRTVKKKAFELVFFSLLAFLLQTIPITVACGLRDILSNYYFTLAFNACINIDIVAGILQPFIYLHQMGKLTFMKYLELPKC